MEISVSIEPFLKGDKAVLRQYIEDIIALGDGKVSVHFDFFVYDEEILQIVGGYSDKIAVHLHSMVDDVQKLLSGVQRYHFASVSVHSDKIHDIVSVMNIETTIYGIVFDLGVDNVGDYGDIIKKCGYATVMTVPSGGSGRSFDGTALTKIVKIREINPAIKIIVDGGINDVTINDVKAAADIAVAGSYCKKCYENGDLENGIKRLLI